MRRIKPSLACCSLPIAEKSAEFPPFVSLDLAVVGLDPFENRGPLDNGIADLLGAGQSPDRVGGIRRQQGLVKTRVYLALARTLSAALPNCNRGLRSTPTPTDQKKPDPNRFHETPGAVWSAPSGTCPPTENTQLPTSNSSPARN
jgi:hypothetical protein